ncbi:MAG: penicillin-binding transpeptidase domain-containing protein [Xanthomonadales bacterium]|nr:penicillin-binding transpeptidase domain-containing protein [Xanthomonadales bacterium]
MSVPRSGQAIVDLRLELETVRSRLILALLLALLALLGLLARYAWLQLVEQEAHRARAEDNRLRFQPLPPPRGLIYDRRGRLLADNTLAYRLELIPERIPDLDATLAELQRLLPLGEEEIQRFHHERSLRRRFHSVPLLFRLSDEEVAAIAVRRHRLPGVELVPYVTRSYPYGPILAHALGYVGRIDARDQERLDRRRYVATTHVGKAGVERQYEDWLHGETGYERVEVNAVGRIIRVLERRPAVAGRALVLALDAALHEAAAAAFGGARGAAVAIDPRRRRGASPAQPSRASSPTTSCAACARPTTAPSARTPTGRSTTARCRGSTSPARRSSPSSPSRGSPTACASRRAATSRPASSGCPGRARATATGVEGGHGWVDLGEALAESVNSYFYALAADLGIERMSEQLGRFGFGRPVGIDLPGEASRGAAVGGVETGADGRALVPRRDRDRRHRSGLLAGHAAAARPGDGAAGGTRAGLPSAPAARRGRWARRQRGGRSRRPGPRSPSPRSTGAR